MMVTAKGNGNGAGQREITAEYHDAAQVGLTKASGQPEGIIFRHSCRSADTINRGLPDQDIAPSIKAEEGWSLTSSRLTSTCTSGGNPHVVLTPSE